jgi:hypothetical protein
MNPLRKSTLLDPRLCRSARKERPSSLTPDEDLHGPRRDAAPPPRRIDPVRQLAVAFDSEARDHPDKRAVLFDRLVGGIRVGSHASVVSVERCPVRRIGARERRHAGRSRVTLPSEEIIQVVVAQSPESYRHNRQHIDRLRHRGPSGPPAAVRR